MRRHALALSLLLLLVPSATAAQETLEQQEKEPPAAEPLDTSLQERVQVQLVELKVRAFDRRGNPIPDIRPEEVRVLEGGVEQRLAYFEPTATRGLVTGADTPQQKPAPLYDARGQVTQGEAEQVAPPKPVRRLVFVFDPRNSRMPVRDDWRLAAMKWVRENMQPGDQAAIVVLRTYPDWVAPLTSDKDVILNLLDFLDLYTDVPDRNRRNEMTRYMTDLDQLCVRQAGRHEEGRASLRGTDLSADVVGCAYNLSLPFSREWAAQTSESVDVLGHLSGQLAAIPGEKIAILFSEGIVDDPAQVLLNAMLSVIGPQKIDVASMLTRLGVDTLWDLSDLHRRASAADVAYFTLDSRHPNEGSEFSNLEANEARPTGTLGLNPWREIYDSTRSTLSALAHATGGKPFYGKDDLEEKIERAAGSFFGIYSLGYYRSHPDRPRGKVTVKIARKKLVLEYDRKPKREAHRARATGIDLVVGRPSGGLDGKQLLPISVLTAIAELPLRPGAGGRGCEVGVFLQAVRPDGEIVAESFETVTIVLDKKDYETVRAKQWRHMAEILVPEGPIRLRARVSDDRQAILADRSIDVTVLQGDVRGGLLSAVN